MVNNNLENNNARCVPQSTGEIPLFSKKVFCKCCNSTFAISRKIKKETNNYYMQCRGSKKRKGRYVFCDNSKIVKKSDLEEIVL